MPRSPLSILSLALASLVYVAFASPAQATVVSFDEFAPSPFWDPQTLSEEYASLGVHFVTTDDGRLMAGMTAAGDPSGWGIAGTNGPNFLGFDGQSYALTATFDVPVSGLQVDVTRPVSNASSFDKFVLRGYLGGIMVDEVMVDVGEPNVWQAVMLAGSVDVIEMFGLSGQYPLHHFAVDNLVWNEDDGGGEVPGEVPGEDPPGLMEVMIDVMPGNDHNHINLSGNRLVSVVLYGSEDVSMMDVDPDSLLFGPTGVGCAHKSGPHLMDYDEDGMMDMKAHFRVRGSGIEHGDPEACVSGTSDGVDFVGCDVISTHKNSKTKRSHKHR